MSGELYHNGRADQTFDPVAIAIAAIIIIMTTYTPADVAESVNEAA